MSAVRKTRGRKTKEETKEDDDVPKLVPAPVRRRGGRANSNINAAKSRLAVIIDMLKTSDDNKLSEDTLRYNVRVSVQHLQKVVDMLD